MLLLHLQSCQPWILPPAHTHLSSTTCNSRMHKPCHFSWIKSSALHMRGPRGHAEGEPHESTAALFSLQDLKLVNVKFL
ncbi:hypothetical protein VNO80_19177 [Phaseolus coccineus]|uniref:Uncharacterized protein n=1 Tax=Phaseolus coccineus TaxID=3886 RepID=A0AAN9MGU1_PHACN